MEFGNLAGKQVLVLGAGLSGMAACRFLLAKGARPTLADQKPEEELPQAAALAQEGVGLLLGNAIPDQFPWDFAVKSPGIPPNAPLVQRLKEAGISIIGELELAFCHAQAPFIAITGTNGKTTTTALIGHMLEQAGKEVLVGGNIGRPLVEEISDYQGLIVAETSSFQLEDCQNFAPHIAVFLNLTPDHLDRHGDMAGYTAAKAKIFSRQQKTDYAVLNADDKLVAALAPQIKSRIIWFSLEKALKEGIFCQEGQIVIALDGSIIPLMPVEDIRIKGRHNVENALAAIGAAYCTGLDAAAIAAGLRSFPGVAHRQEVVLEQGGILYINDSKGTNPASTIKALEACDAPIILIAGGRDKGGDFAPLMALAKEKVRLMVLVGEARGIIQKAADAAGFNRYVLADSFAQGVEQAAAAARPGEIVLLSPACASWDMFKDYAERGNLFKKLVTERSQQA